MTEVDGGLLAGVVIPTTPCPPARHSLAEWYAEADQLDHIRLRALDDEDDAVAAWDDRADDPTKWAGRDAILSLARDGKTLDEIAELLDASIEEVAKPLTHGASDVPKVITVERVWRQHPSWGCGQIARTAGVSNAFVSRLVRRLGGSFATTEQIRDGGGGKYTREQYDAIRAMRERGDDYRRISKALGIPYTSVARICLRRGFKPLNAAPAPQASDVKSDAARVGGVPPSPRAA